MMYNYSAEQFWGKDGKYYLIGAEKLDQPMGCKEANYEVRYIEYLEKHKSTQQGVPSWFDEDWEIIGRYRSLNPINAIAQGREELRRRDIYPSGECKLSIENEGDGKT